MNTVLVVLVVALLLRPL